MQVQGDGDGVGLETRAPPPNAPETSPGGGGGSLYGSMASLCLSCNRKVPVVFEAADEQCLSVLLC